ncbi:hypothetical protein FF1_043648 [Malus domestica]
MEPDVSIETSAMIRVAVLPIGHVAPVLLLDYHSMLLRHHTIPLSAISSFYTEHQKSPFAHQPWDSGNLRFKFVLGGAPPSPWEDFQSNRKTLAVIGICHCPSSPDLDSIIEQFDSARRLLLRPRRSLLRFLPRRFSVGGWKQERREFDAVSAGGSGNLGVPLADDDAGHRGVAADGVREVGAES